VTANRNHNLARLKNEMFDVLIVGSGINGAVSAAALAARGVSVALIDKKDFASFTSQESSFLVWGGIKYLENYELGLVRDLCLSRNNLMKYYPSTVKEIRFFSPHHQEFRHSLKKLLAGVWFYWLMGSGKTARPRALSRETIASEEPNVDLSRIDGGFEYSDAYLVDCDARFVFSFVRAAMATGASAANYVEATAAHRSDGLWHTTVRDTLNGATFTIKSRLLLNAAGPYVDAFNAATTHIKTRTRHLFSKGIHLIVKRLSENHRILTFVADDKRMFFIIPMGPVSCVGTTDTRVQELPSVVTAEDRNFVLAQINKNLKLPRPLTHSDIIAERCGVRPLAVETGDSDPTGMDFLTLSRKHVIEVDAGLGCLSIFGGKLTDCLNVGEEITALVADMKIPVKKTRDRWYGEPPICDKISFLARCHELQISALRRDPKAEDPTERLWRRYGLGAFNILDAIVRDPKQGEVLHLGTELLVAEIVHMAQHEMILTLEDFVRRRTMISLLSSRAALKGNPELEKACRLLFGETAPARWAEYFAAHPRTLSQPAA
jgi:glycerol-3-phosphate dehydrogenase